MTAVAKATKWARRTIHERREGKTALIAKQEEAARRLAGDVEPLLGIELQRDLSERPDCPVGVSGRSAAVVGTPDS